MAKIKGPLFSQAAHGSIADILSFSKKRTGQQTRKYNKPLADPSGAQRGQRRLTEFLVAQWQNMSDADKATWAANARTLGVKLSGYHFFMREAQRDLYTHHGLCGYWHCNEIVGGKVLDLSGNRNHGTLQPTYPSDAPTIVASRSTRFSKALKYNGNDYVNVPYNATLNFAGGSFTLGAWIKSGSLSPTAAGPIVARDVGSNKASWWVRVQSDYKILFLVSGEGGPEESVFSASTVLNTWTHVVAVKDNSTSQIHIYIDGVLENSASDATGSNDPTNNNPLRIGNYNADAADRYFNGAIDEICIYNRALSAAEIATRYKFATAKI